MAPRLAHATKFLLAAAILAAAASAQSPATPPAFEVASIKPSTSADLRSMGTFKMNPGGKLSIENVRLYMIVAAAYQVSVQSVRLSGGPDWIRSTTYDIDAAAEKGAIPANLSPEARKAKMRAMLQTLLAERFHLSMLRETKDLPVYAVTVGRNGPKLQKSKTAEADCGDPDDSAKQGAPCHEFMGGQGRGLHGKAVSMQDLVYFVENWSDRPMVDQTGLGGLFDIESVGWVPLRGRPPVPPGTPPSAEDLAYADSTIPTLFTVFDRLGLKLEATKAPVTTFVIEHIEKPTAN
jgi:uncharacterized protein (TIGR03435 family)